MFAREHHRALAAAGTVSCCLVFGRPAHAQAPLSPPPADQPSAQGSSADDFAKREARTHFDQGIDAFVQGAFETALTQFRLSAELFPTRAAVTNASLCLQRLGRGDEALTLLKTISERFGPLSADDQKELDRVTADLSRDVGWIELRGVKPGTTILIDGRIRGATPFTAPLYVTKGIHQVRIAEVPPLDQTVDVVAGQANVVSIPESPPPVVPSPLETNKDQPVATPPPRPARWTIGADIGAALSSLGGDIAGCSGGCDTNVGFGVRARGTIGYRVDASWTVGLEAGYVRLDQHANQRATSLRSFERSEPGTASDALTMSGGVVGGVLDFHLPLPVDSSVRAGLGVFLGAVRDEREFRTSPEVQTPDGNAFSVSPAQRAGAQYAYASLGATMGYRFADRLQVGAALDLLFMGALGLPRWNEIAFQGDAGASTFSNDALASTFLVVFCPSLELRLDF